MESHDEEGPGPAERACLRTAKRKRGRGRIASHSKPVTLTPLIVQSRPFEASKISLNRTLKVLRTLQLASYAESMPPEASSAE
jgi:hypothetical protein